MFLHCRPTLSDFFTLQSAYMCILLFVTFISFASVTCTSGASPTTHVLESYKNIVCGMFGTAVSRGIKPWIFCAGEKFKCSNHILIIIVSQPMAVDPPLDSPG